MHRFKREHSGDRGVHINWLCIQNLFAQGLLNGLPGAVRIECCD
jgi:hypothetical protein